MTLPPGYSIITCSDGKEYEWEREEGRQDRRTEPGGAGVPLGQPGCRLRQHGTGG